jgi:hypothetical protein
MNDDKPTLIEYFDGTKCWHLNGLAHREDGPALDFSNGEKYYYLNGVPFSEEAYWKELFKNGLITEKELFLKLL